MSQFLVGFSLDDESHDFTSSPSNHHEPGITEVPLDRQVSCVANTTMYLQRLMSDLKGSFRSEEFRHGPFFPRPHPVVHKTSSLKNKKTGRLEFQSHFCNLETDAFELPDGTAELFSLRRVSNGRLERGTRYAQHSSGHCRSFSIQLVK